MTIGNFAHELAALRAEQERDAGIKAARAPLSEAGSAVCISCGEDIDEERRAAMPSARRCIDCQTRIERYRARRGR